MPTGEVKSGGTELEAKKKAGGVSQRGKGGTSLGVRTGVVPLDAGQGT